MIQTLRSPWAGSFENLVGMASSSLVLCSPYIGQEPCARIVSKLREQDRTSIEVLVLTDLSRDNMLSGATDVTALVRLCEAVPRTEVRFLPSVHAKVYVADRVSAIVTSGNMTLSGLSRNLEYGMLVSDESLVGEIRADVLAYRAIGSKVTLPQLRTFQQVVQELSGMRNEVEKSARCKLRQEFDAKLHDASEVVLRTRVDGLGAHATFADTILYVLKDGPKSTKEIYEEIHRIHPDLCDDSVKLVIHGEEWSQAKWRHRARHAQQFLSRRGDVVRVEGRWHLSQPA